MKKIAVLFSGIGTNLQYIIKTLHLKELEVAVAITDKANAGGIAIAQEADIPVEIIAAESFGTREEFDSKLVETIRLYNPDLTVLAGFMRILTPIFTEQIEAINLHPSLLPRHKGLHAIERSYNDSHPEGGVSVHWVSSELDGGEIIFQKTISKNGLSLEAYTHKIKIAEKEVLSEAILKVLGTRSRG